MNQAITRTQDTTLNTAVTPSQLLTLAIESKADPDRLDKLMDLQIKWEATQAKKAYVVAMTKFRSECPAIDKTKNGHNNKYAGLSETIETIKGLLSSCGLSHTWKTNQDKDAITIRCVVTHVLGHSEETSLTASPDTTGSKNPIQAIGSTVSYLERYTLFALLGLASQDMDNDANGNGKDAPKPEDDITKLLEQAFWDYGTEHADEVADGFAYDGVKFKDALKVKVKLGRTPHELKAFKWTAESIKDLAAKIKASDVLAEIK